MSLSIPFHPIIDPCIHAFLDQVNVTPDCESNDESSDDEMTEFRKHGNKKKNSNINEVKISTVQKRITKTTTASTSSPITKNNFLHSTDSKITNTKNLLKNKKPSQSDDRLNSSEGLTMEQIKLAQIESGEKWFEIRIKVQEPVSEQGYYGRLGNIEMKFIDESTMQKGLFILDDGIIKLAKKKDNY